MQYIQLTGSTAVPLTFYYRTKYFKKLLKMFKDGFLETDRKPLMGVYSWDSVQGLDGSTYKTMGGFVIECRIKTLQNFLIFDKSNLAERVHGPISSIKKQFCDGITEFYKKHQQKIDTYLARKVTIENFNSLILSLIETTDIAKHIDGILTYNLNTKDTLFIFNKTLIHPLRFTISSKTNSYINNADSPVKADWKSPVSALEQLEKENAMHSTMNTDDQ